MIKNTLTGLDDLDLPSGALSGALTDIPEFGIDDPKFPLIVCNNVEEMTKRLSKLNTENVSAIALAITVSEPCSGNGIASGFNVLSTRFGTKFNHVLVVSHERNSRHYEVEGYTDAESFRDLIDPQRAGMPDQNMTNAIAKYAGTNADAMVAFNFVVKKIAQARNIGSMIRAMVQNRANEVLVQRSGRVRGAASITVAFWSAF